MATRGSQARVAKTVKIRGNGRQRISDKTVGSRMWSHIQGLLRRLPRSRSIDPKVDGSRVATDWVTGQSYSHVGDGSMHSQAYVRTEYHGHLKISESLLLLERNSMFQMAIFGYFCVTLVSRDKRKRALMYFMRQSSMIIGTLLETSYCLKPGSVEHDARCSTKNTRRTCVGARQTDEETSHNTTRKHLARRMVKHVRKLSAQSSK